MQAADLTLGKIVQIVAADEFYAYVDGWIGTFEGWRSGYAVIKCKHKDGIDKEILVPTAQLREISPFGVYPFGGING